jgi:hypothetical protein
MNFSPWCKKGDMGIGGDQEIAGSFPPAARPFGDNDPKDPEDPRNPRDQCQSAADLFDLSISCNPHISLLTHLCLSVFISGKSRASKKIEESKLGVLASWRLRPKKTGARRLRLSYDF